MARLSLEDGAQDAVMKMVDGNPGAMNTLMVVLKEGSSIDPQNAFGAMGAIFALDEWEIYGTDIYILFNDKCDRDIRRMLMIIRATQLGFFPDARLQEMAHDQMRQINLTDKEWKEIDDKVCKQLEEFAKPKTKEVNK